MGHGVVGPWVWELQFPKPQSTRARRRETAPQHCLPPAAAETSLLQIKTNFESNLNLALKNYNVTADQHSEAVDTIQRTVSAPVCLLVPGG